ncbi:hypothetical protein ACTXMK_05270 [Psychrobacter celer]|uniref:hypothetical protein n=1 Tax=Psychrobacter celer TaxID=306572 RepID=UPI003FD04991
MNTLKKEVYHMERFTAKPKWWGKLRHKSRLTPAEYLVLDVIFDKTIDWNKTTDRISISQFMDELGLSNKGVINTLKSLNKKGLIFLLKQDRKTNTISIKMKAIEAYSNMPTCEVSSQDKKQTCELSSQSSELSSYQLVNSVHTHDTRDHYPIPFIYIRGYQLLNDYGVCKKTESELAKKQIDESARLLVEFWNSNHGKSKSADVKPSVWTKTAKARLKNFTVDEIKTAMLSVIQSTWHQQNGQVLIKNAISSDQRCDEAISRYHQAQQTNYQGKNNANHQSANSQPKSKAEQYRDMLNQQYAERYGQPQPTERTVN